MPKRGFRFAFLGFASALVLAQFLLFSALVAVGSLPNPIASHWGFDGKPDGFSEANLYLIATTSGYLLLLVAMGLVGFWQKRRLLQPLLFGLLGFVFIFTLASISITVSLQIGKSAEEADIEPWLMISLLVIPIGLAGLALGTPRVSVGQDFRVKVFGLTLLKLDFADFTGVVRTQLRARDFGGLGIRYGKKTLAFISTPGSGVLISTNFGESIAIRTKQPEILVAAIAARIGK